MLVLQTRKEIFNRLKTGELREFFLPYKPFYQTKLLNYGLLKLQKREGQPCADPVPSEEEAIVKIRNGYHSTSPLLVCRVKCREAKFAQGKKAYILDIKEILLND